MRDVNREMRVLEKRWQEGTDPDKQEMDVKGGSELWQALSTYQPPRHLSNNNKTLVYPHFNSK